jgi:hypothetical protein
MAELEAVRARIRAYRSEHAVALAGGEQAFGAGDPRRPRAA